MPKPHTLQKEDTFHQARSRLVDAFARLETRVIKSLNRAGKPVKGDTVATKLKTLRDAATDASISASGISFDQLGTLISKRADIVHGEMILVDVDGERLASFRNARESIEIVQRASQISYNNLKTLAEQLDAHSSALDNLKFTAVTLPKSVAISGSIAA
jgi:hypothetical protein